MNIYTFVDTSINATLVFDSKEKLRAFVDEYCKRYAEEISEFGPDFFITKNVLNDDERYENDMDLSEIGIDLQNYIPCNNELNLKIPAGCACTLYDSGTGETTIFTKQSCLDCYVEDMITNLRSYFQRSETWLPIADVDYEFLICELNSY